MGKLSPTSIPLHPIKVARQIGPSLTPLTNLNSGFRMYEVDSGVRSSLSSHVPLPTHHPEHLVL